MSVVWAGVASESLASQRIIGQLLSEHRENLDRWVPDDTPNVPRHTIPKDNTIGQLPINKDSDRVYLGIDTDTRQEIKSGVNTFRVIK